MRVLALIPARGGSKRLPGKNIRILGGKPLIVWSIESVKGIPEICDILVSTDDLNIAAICANTEALVPWLRPPELATDMATSIDVCKHAMDWYEREKGPIDGLMLLQPTSPFRKPETIATAIKLFKENNNRPVVTFSPAESHPMWCYRVEGNAIYPFVGAIDQSSRSQDLEPAYVINGEIYIATPEYLRSHTGFLCNETVPLLVEDHREALDIDTDHDWLIAESLLTRP